MIQVQVLQFPSILNLYLTVCKKPKRCYTFSHFRQNNFHWSDILLLFFYSSYTMLTQTTHFKEPFLIEPAPSTTHPVCAGVHAKY